MAGAALGAAALVAVVAVGAAAAAGPARRAALPGDIAEAHASPLAPCGRRVAEPAYAHVLWVVMENEPYSAVVGSSAAPFTTALARACGVADHYVAVTHPSLPNYLALTAGATFGIADDNDPSSHRLAAPSIFSQLDAHHLTWASYEESMTVPCEQVSAGLYAVKHNPAAYFVPLRAECRRNDVPLGSLATGPLARQLRSGDLPSFTLVVPNVCDDGHSCPLVLADLWLRRLVATVATSRAYAEGHLAVFVTWDEGSGIDQQVPLVVMAPSVPRHTVATRAFSHFGLLRTTEQLLGLPPLGAARGAASMATAFHL